MNLFFYFSKVIGFLLLVFTGVGTVWYAYDGLGGSNVGLIYLTISASLFTVITYLLYRKKIMVKSHFKIIIPIILVLGVLCITTSPILLHYTDAVHWVWLVEAIYDPEVGVLFLMFARDVVLLDKAGITAHVGFDAYNFGNATVMQGMSARMIIFEIPEPLQDSLPSGMVISVGPGAIGAADPHTTPNTMPPTIVITTPGK